MCSGAIINSRLAEVYYGAFDPKAGAAGSVIDLFKVEKFNHHPKIYGGLFRDQAAQMLKDFSVKLDVNKSKINSGKINQNTVL